jgi:mRNA interferase MazF
MSGQDLVPGDIVLVPFPYTNYFNSKPRPALVISSVAFNKKSLDVVLVAFTSNISTTAVYSVKVLISDPGFTATGLKVSSTILCGKIFAMDKTHIYKKLGKLPDVWLQPVRGVLSNILLS